MTSQRTEGETGFSRHIEATLGNEDVLEQLSHELRTPLTIVSGTARALVRMGDQLSPDDLYQALRDIAHDSSRLEATIENVLLLARLPELPLLELEPQPIRPLIASAVQAHVRAFPEREVRVDVAADTPLVAVNDRHIVQLLTNLLSNAAKYSPDGSAITVSGRRTGESAEVQVRDRGVGVDAGEVGRLFEPFYRSPATHAMAPGLGLGLTVVREVAAAHSASVAIRPRDGGGTAVIVGFPPPA